MADEPCDGDEELVQPGGGRSTRIAAAIAVGVIALAVLAFAATRSLQPARQSAKPTTSAIVATPIPVTAGPTAARAVDFPAVPVMRAVQQACAGSSTCRVLPGSHRLHSLARQAIGVAGQLEIRLVVGHALIAAARYADGRQLLAIVTRPGTRVDQRRLGITPPLGLQAQDNDRDRLTVSVSGSAAALRLLARPRIQRWLAHLTI